MSKPSTIVLELEKVVDELVSNAKELKELSTRSTSEEELSPLQGHQEKLIKKLKSVNTAITKQFKKGIGNGDGSVWARVEKKLEMFQNYNEQFISNLSVLKGLIHFEIQDIKKTRQSVAKLKAAYGPKGKGGKGSPPSKNINTVS